MKHPYEHWKYLPAARIIELLSHLPGEMPIAPNLVGNLAIMDPDDIDSIIGFIDFTYEGRTYLSEVEDIRNYNARILEKFPEEK